MIEILALLAALFSTPAMAQCTGTFGPQTVCGNATGSAGQPRPSAFATFSGGAAGGGSTLANITRNQIPSNNLSGQTTITLNGYFAANDMGLGATYSQTGANCTTGLMYIKDSVGTCFNLIIPPGSPVNVGWFGVKADNGATTITGSDVSNNPQWRGTYTSGMTWDYVGTQEAVYAAFAPCSTPGSIQWNAVVFCNTVVAPLYVPQGRSGTFYGINNTVLVVAQGFTIKFADRLSTQYNWTGTSAGTAWLFNSGSYGLIENFSVTCSVAANFGSAVPCLQLDHTPSTPGGLKTQQLTFINLYVQVGVNGQGVALNPVAGSGGQGDTISFINSIIVGDFASSDYAYWIDGNNTQVNIIGGDIQGFPHDGIKVNGGSVAAYNLHSENQNLSSSTPILTQFTTYGSDFDFASQANGSSASTVDGYRAEDNILSSSGGNTYLQNYAGVSFSNAGAIGVDIHTWPSSTTLFQGYVVNGGTKNRPFMLVDSSGTSWNAITSGSANVITDSGASYTTNQWVGFDAAVRFGSNGFTQRCTITANTATTITFNPACSANPLSSQNEYQIIGVTGGSAPSWDSATAGNQAPFQGTGQGFNTTAGSTCVGIGGSIFGGINVNDYVVIPNADQVAPSGSPIWRMPLYAKVTAKSGSPCGGGTTADSLTVSKAAAYTLVDNPGYFGTPITDNNDKWIELAFDTIQGANIVDNVVIGIGLIGNTPAARYVSNNTPTAWLDTNFSKTLNGSNQNQQFGLSQQAMHDVPCTNIVGNGTIALDNYIGVCNVITVTPTGAITFTAPLPINANNTSQEITIFIIQNGTNLMTFSTNFASNGPMPTSAAIGNNYLIKFRSYNSVWQEVARFPNAAAGSNATVASPSGPNSTSVFTMQGLAGTITPKKSGNINIQICSTIVETGLTAVGNGIQTQLSYGTSTAPTSNAALTGTQVGTVAQYLISATATAADVQVPLCQTAIVTGLTVGTAYWLDLAAKAISNTGFSLSAVNIAAHEF